jgi:tRNA A58 N-methylase Trm61
MFEAIVSTLLGLWGTALLGVMAWAVKLSNRVAVLEADKDSLKDSIREILDLRFQDVNRRLDRIENKIDRNEEQ